MSSKKDCHINPLTGRAIKTSGAIYKKIMEKEKNVTTIQASIQSKKAQSDLNEKKEAVNKLKAVVKRTTTKPPEVKQNIIEQKPPDLVFNRMKKFINEYKRTEMYKKGVEADVFNDYKKAMDFYKKIGPKYENERDDLKKILKPWIKYPGFKQDDPTLKWSKNEKDIYQEWTILIRLIKIEKLGSDMIELNRYKNKKKK